MTASPDYSGLLYRALLLLLSLVVLLGMGTYMHGAWNLVDEAVCGVIVAASWFCSRPKDNGFRSSPGPSDRRSSLEAFSFWWHQKRIYFPCEVVAVVAAVTTAAFFDPWSTNEVVVVGGLVILPQILNLPYIRWYRRITEPVDGDYSNRCCKCGEFGHKCASEKGYCPFEVQQGEYIPS